MPAPRPTEFNELPADTRFSPRKVMFPSMPRPAPSEELPPPLMVLLMKRSLMLLAVTVPPEALWIHSPPPSPPKSTVIELPSKRAGRVRRIAGRRAAEGVPVEADQARRGARGGVEVDRAPLPAGSVRREDRVENRWGDVARELHAAAVLRARPERHGEIDDG